MGVMWLGAPGVGEAWAGLLFIALTGLVIGLAWIRRIAAGDEDLGSSFWRSHPHGGRGSRLPAWPGDEPPTLGWIAARTWIAVGLGSVFAAVAGPIVLTRWERPVEESAALAGALWVGAIMAAVIGTWWMLRILSRDP